ncbi:probable arginine--tRNA ligase, mitochondrial [Harmonia axyridis]|uniref:probable arginine--tRNA ligase, mitochondrial n=1 Tax=Harmonia axyridis TaxID=115357 RepID=UPI001E2796DE|nr:probable arginine--tRNA ligase, mitochondrial [Harmonia axyridis]
MSTKLKLYIGRKIIECLKKPTTVTPTELLPWIHIGKNLSEKHIEMAIPLDILEKNLGITNISEILKIQPDDIIRNISYANNRANRKVQFEVERNIFIKDVMENCAKPDFNLKPKTIVFEYSSPNIAKPFHFGHLRSTIIGNFLSNLNKFLYNKVTRLNYLGDWGTQFGFIKVGIDELKYSKENIKNNPLKLLYESYVFANKLSEKDASVSERAKIEFKKLESGSPELLDIWKEYMGYTKDELEIIYRRLGVEFDEYYYESMYSANNIQNIIDKLQEKKVIRKDSDGKLVVSIDKKIISVLKSDGSTLYLTRDIAAAIDRFNKYKFDKMYYVVDNSQSEHFKTLKEMLYRLDLPWANRLHHIKFGRIRGFSTRRGNAVFLKDILDECREKMIQKQITSPTTKVPIEDNETSDTLGVSCVIINDLKQRRQKDYEFAWDNVLQVQGDTGVKLQYTHCRLHSLEENCGIKLPQQLIPEILVEPDALNLIRSIAKFQDVLYETEEKYEACILVNYLFRLCNDISKSLKVLKIKGSEPDVGAQRLLLFVKAREVLHAGMSIIGLNPLKKM